MKAQSCALVILASGQSKRFGPEDKLMASFKGKPLCAHIIHAQANLPFAKRYAVISKHSAKCKAVFEQAGFTNIDNPYPERGRGYSLTLGAQTVLASGGDAMCVALADMPLIDVAHIQTLLERADTPITISTHRSTNMPPAVFSGPALTHLSDPKNKRQVLFKTMETTHVSLTKIAAQDIDTKADLHAMEQGYKL